MYQISGFLQNYAWGVPGGLIAWQSDQQRAETDEAAPQAELWFGAHQNGPSLIVGSESSLRDSVNPDQVPLLVKLLAAHTPLSIQIHPPADQARETFQRQRQDPTLPQLLADSLAKTEMLIAVKSFSVFQGLRELALAEQILREVGPELDSPCHSLNAGDVKLAIQELLDLPKAGLGVLVARVPAAAREVGIDEASVAALELVAETYPEDPGVFVAALLEHRTLEPGQAVYVPAGVVHAYVRGTGVEVMTASDNVLRLGLTPKTIAVSESLRALNPELVPEPMSGDPQTLATGGSIRMYRPSGAPFTVDLIEKGRADAPAGAYRLVLAVEDSTIVTSDTDSMELAQGEAAAVLADESAVDVATHGIAVVARAVDA